MSRSEVSIATAVACGHVFMAGNLAEFEISLTTQNVWYKCVPMMSLSYQCHKSCPSKQLYESSNERPNGIINIDTVRWVFDSLQRLSGKISPEQCKVVGNKELQEHHPPYLDHERHLGLV